jgi:hypothetical protein
MNWKLSLRISTRTKTRLTTASIGCIGFIQLFIDASLVLLAALLGFTYLLRLRHRKIYSLTFVISLYAILFLARCDSHGWNILTFFGLKDSEKIEEQQTLGARLHPMEIMQDQTNLVHKIKNHKGQHVVCIPAGSNLDIPQQMISQNYAQKMSQNKNLNPEQARVYRRCLSRQIKNDSVSLKSCKNQVLLDRENYHSQDEELFTEDTHNIRQRNHIKQDLAKDSINLSKIFGHDQMKSAKYPTQQEQETSESPEGQDFECDVVSTLQSLPDLIKPRQVILESTPACIDDVKNTTKASKLGNDNRDQLTTKLTRNAQKNAITQPKIFQRFEKRERSIPACNPNQKSEAINCLSVQ